MCQEADKDSCGHREVKQLDNRNDSTYKPHTVCEVGSRVT